MDTGRGIMPPKSFINSERPFINMGSEIIYRDEAEEIKELKGWILVYGRHKVGKTF